MPAVGPYSLTRSPIAVRSMVVGRADAPGIGPTSGAPCSQNWESRRLEIVYESMWPSSSYEINHQRAVGEIETPLQLWKTMLPRHLRPTHQDSIRLEDKQAPVDSMD